MSQENNIKSSMSDTDVRYGLRGRMMTGFFTVVLVFIVSVVITLQLIWRVEIDADVLLNHGMKASHVIDDMQVAFNKVTVDVQSVVIFNDKAKRQRIVTAMAGVDDLALQTYGDITSLGDTAINEKWAQFKSALVDYRSKLEETLRLADAVSNDKAIEMYKNELLPATVKVYAAINEEVTSASTSKGLLDVVNDRIRLEMNDIVIQVERVAIVVIISMLLAMLLSYLIAHYTAKSIINPLKYAINIAKRVATGERGMDIVSSRADETGQLISSLSVMHDAIQTGEEQKKRYAEEIMQACTVMVSTLEQVRQAVDAQSSGASEQASSINQITASITEIEKSATQTMNKAKDLGGVAEKTRESGQLGLESIESSVIGMKSVKDKVQLIAQTILDLSRQTQQVGEITSVVNNLAQQSKMLALNASIEAAKAGDAGKGFTVVASEVKNLAEQSEQSTSQVQKILEDIKVATEKAVMVTEEGTKGVDSGLQMIERTGDIIRDLNEVIREASIASQQIEAAVRQEGAGIEQITAGMNEINTVTASFVESASQTTQAMHDLAKVSKKLKSSVETYKI